MKKTTILLVALIAFVVTNYVSGVVYTIVAEKEVDPATSLDNYITFGEWNTDGDLEGWSSYNLVNVAAYGGSITGVISGIDSQIQTNLSTGQRIRLDSGSIVELRMRYDSDSSITNTTAQIFFNDGANFYKIVFAGADELQTDGNFHIYRITLTNNIPSTNRVRVDPLGSGYNGNTFAIDYIRMKLSQMVDPIDKSGKYFNYSTDGDLANWNTDDDYEGWVVANMSPNWVSGGYLTATNNGDGQVYKTSNQGLPAINLDENNIIEFRMKRETINGDRIDLFFGTANNPGASATRLSSLNGNAIPLDGDYHIYRFDMSRFSTWNGTLQTVRLDPTTTVNRRVDIDYIRIGRMDQQPTQVSNVSFDIVGDTSVELLWDNGNGDGRLIICREGSNPSSGPMEGTNYTANSTFGSGDSLGDGYVVYKGNSDMVTINGLTVNTEYYFQAFEYKSSGTIYYNTSSAIDNPNSTTTTPEPGIFSGIIILSLSLAGIKRQLI